MHNPCPLKQGLYELELAMSYELVSPVDSAGGTASAVRRLGHPSEQWLPAMLRIDSEAAFHGIEP